jgi:hypothetical protein
MKIPLIAAAFLLVGGYMVDRGLYNGRYVRAVTDLSWQMAGSFGLHR